MQIVTNMENNNLPLEPIETFGSNFFTETVFIATQIGGPNYDLEIMRQQLLSNGRIPLTFIKDKAFLHQTAHSSPPGIKFHGALIVIVYKPNTFEA
jgi:hypothetical protein